MKTRAGKDTSWYAISRIGDRRGAPVFVAAVKRHGLRISKNFVVAAHGNEEAALTAARQWRDRVLALLPPMTYRQVHMRVRANCASGIPGVQRRVKRSGAYWVAAFESARQRQVKHFSVAEHGEDGAKQLAIEARRTMLQSVEDKVWLATPAAKALSAQSSAAVDVAPDSNELVWDEETQERLLKELRDEGLITTPSRPSVARHDFASQVGPVWQATYVTPAGKRIVRRFSVGKYGEAKAQRLAEEAFANLVVEHCSSGPTTREMRLPERLAAMPDKLLDVLLEIFELRSDAALARRLGVAATTVSKIRRGALPLRSALLVRILEACQLHIRSLYALVERR